jgi:hypothetical protein
MRRSSIFVALLGAVLTLEAPALAQTFGPRSRSSWETPQNFAIELRIGSFSENIDGQLGLAGRGPFQEIFCSTRDPNAAAGTAVGCPLRFRGGLEFDWQILRLGPVGSLGVGAIASYSNATARAPATAGMTSTDPTVWRRTAQDTSLQVLQSSIHAVLRVDVLARRIRWLPLAPYAKAGIALAPWWVTNGERNARDPITNEDAIGLSHGFFLAGGVAVMLDTFEPDVARQWDQTSGVNHSYLFFELNYTYLGGFTRRTLDVGGLAWTAGVAIEF